MTYHLTLLLLILTSCLTTDNKWADWTESEKHFADNKVAFDSLTFWLLTNYQAGQPLFIRIDSLPSDKHDNAKKLGIKNILLETDFCSITDTRGGQRLTYLFNETKTTDVEQIFFYLIYARCLPDDLKKNIKTNGTYKKVGDKWYLVQKNYDWHFD